MDDSSNAAARRWSASPSVKEKNAVQRAVTALLDELAPERLLKRGDNLNVRIEQHRTPNGCVLQAAKAAMSVSWFAEPDTNAPLGELHVLVWRGTVARRGTLRKAEGATLVKELVLLPIEHPLDECLWRNADGATFDTATLAAHCVALLEEQISADQPAAPASGDQATPFT